MWHVWGTGKVYTGFWQRDLREIDHFEDVGIDGRIILKCTFDKWDGETWNGLLWFMTEAGGGACECRIENSDSIKCRKFMTK